MTNVGELVTKFSIDNSDLVAKLKQSESRINTFTKIGVGALVGFATAATTAFTTMGVSVRNTSKELGDLYDNAQKLSIGVSAFQSLEFAASKAGVSTAGLQNTLAVMQRLLGEASLTGQGSAADALDTLGISIKDIIDLAPDKQFEILAEALGKVNNVAERGAIAKMVFGRGAKDSLALFNTDLAKTRETFVELGLAISDSQAAAADELDETLSLVGKIGNAFEQKLTAKVAPALTEMVLGLIEVGQQTTALEVISDSFAKGFLQGFKIIIAGASQVAKVLNAIKKEFDGFTDRLADVRDTAFELTARALGDPSQTIGEARQFRSQSNGDFISQQAIDNLDAIYTGLDKSQDRIGKNLSAGEEFGGFLPVIKDVGKSFEKVGQAVEKAADKFNDVISTIFQEQGRSELERILKPITDEDKKLDSLNALPKARNSTFDQIVLDTVRNFSLPGADTEALKQSLPKTIKELENIISTEAGGFGQLGVGTKAGGTFSITGNTNKDVTGMIGALQELKKFVGLDEKKQKIDINVKVEKSKDFVTTVFTDAEAIARMNENTKSVMAKEAIGVKK